MATKDVEGVAKALYDFSEHFKCRICLEIAITPTRVSGCGHFFCHLCIIKYLEQNKRASVCPLCKGPVSRRGLQKDDNLANLISAFKGVKTAIKSDTRDSINFDDFSLVRESGAKEEPPNVMKKDKKPKVYAKKAKLDSSSGSSSIVFAGERLKDDKRPSSESLKKTEKKVTEWLNEKKKVIDIGDPYELPYSKGKKGKVKKSSVSAQRQALKKKPKEKVLSLLADWDDSDSNKDSEFDKLLEGRKKVPLKAAKIVTSPVRECKTLTKSGKENKEEDEESKGDGNKKRVKSKKIVRTKALKSVSEGSAKETPTPTQIIESTSSSPVKSVELNCNEALEKPVERSDDSQLFDEIDNELNTKSENEKKRKISFKLLGSVTPKRKRKICKFIQMGRLCLPEPSDDEDPCSSKGERAQTYPTLADIVSNSRKRKSSSSICKAGIDSKMETNDNEDEKETLNKETQTPENGKKKTVDDGKQTIEDPDRTENNEKAIEDNEGMDKISLPERMYAGHSVYRDPIPTTSSALSPAQKKRKLARNKKKKTSLCDDDHEEEVGTLTRSRRLKEKKKTDSENAQVLPDVDSETRVEDIDNPKNTVDNDRAIRLGESVGKNTESTENENLMEVTENNKTNKTKGKKQDSPRKSFTKNVMGDYSSDEEIPTQNKNHPDKIEFEKKVEEILQRDRGDEKFEKKRSLRSEESESNTLDVIPKRKRKRGKNKFESPKKASQRNSTKFQSDFERIEKEDLQIEEAKTPQKTDMTEMEEETESTQEIRQNLNKLKKNAEKLKGSLSESLISKENDRVSSEDSSSDEEDLFGSTPGSAVPKVRERSKSLRASKVARKHLNYSTVFSEPFLDEDGDGQQPISQVIERKKKWEFPPNFELISSGLTSSMEREYLNRFIDKYEINLSLLFSDSVTHVIVATDDNLRCKRTLKYLQGVAGGRVVVAFKWIQSCLDDDILVDPEQFLALDTYGNNTPEKSLEMRRKGGPRLFRNFQISLVGCFGAVLSSERLKELILLAGGKVARNVNCFDFDSNLTNIFVMDKDMKMGPGEAGKIFRSSNIIVIDKDWIIDSLGAYMIQPLTLYIQHEFDTNRLQSLGYSESLLLIQE